MLSGIQTLLSNIKALCFSPPGFIVTSQLLFLCFCHATTRNHLKNVALGHNKHRRRSFISFDTRFLTGCHLFVKIVFKCEFLIRWVGKNPTFILSALFPQGFLSCLKQHSNVFFSFFFLSALSCRKENLKSQSHNLNKMDSLYIRQRPQLSMWPHLMWLYMWIQQMPLQGAEWGQLPHSYWFTNKQQEPECQLGRQAESPLSPKQLHFLPAED